MNHRHLFSLFALISIFSILSAPFAPAAANRTPLPAQIEAGALRLAVNQPTVLGEVQAASKEAGLYILQLSDPPVASYRGGIDGFAATSPAITGARKLDARSSAALAYASYLEDVQRQFLSDVEQALGVRLAVKYQYFHAINGMALYLTAEQAAQVGQLPGVLHIEPDTAHPIDTDVGPTWIGAPGVWDGSATGLPGTMGEGIIVGVMDTGINWDHPSFAAVGGDGYVHTNPYGAGVFVGWCDPGDPNYDPSLVCNDKLIGMWDFADADETPDGPGDNNGHGSHTSSTAAGNVVTATLFAPTAAISDTISGVAPHANLISYDVCGGQSCANSNVVAAINQAILDGVDVTNESIGIGGDAFTGSKQAAYLGLFDAGVVASRSAGNSGPAPATVGPEPPWTLSSAALTHNRSLINSLVNISGGGTPPPADIQGVGFTSGYGPAPIVYAGDFPSGSTSTPELCGVGALGDFISPWSAGTFNGEIVVCDRGTFGRVEKGANVLFSGAGGYVLVDNGSGLVSDPHALPGVHITASDGAALKAWLADGGSGHSASISGVTVDYSASNGDVLAGFSSRGPAPVDVLKPDVGAPGVAIWAAYLDNPGGPDDGQEYTFLGGTSMASPHTAGAAALLVDLYPGWTPAQIRSALMTTATTANTLKEDGATPTDPHDVGAGRIDVAQAANAGLVLDETSANFAAADPNASGDPSTLNLASMADAFCYQFCSFDRALQSTLGSSSTWDITTSTSDPRTQISLSANQVTIGAAGTFTLSVSVDVSGVPVEQWTFGEVELTEASNAAPPVRLPIAVYVPGSTDFNTFNKLPSTMAAGLTDLVWYTMTVNNLTVVTDTFEAKDFLAPGMEYVAGSASASTGTVTGIGNGELEWQGQLAGGDLELLPTSITGYVSLASLGVPPFPCPTNCDDGGWIIGGLDFSYLGTQYSDAIWSVNGGLEPGSASLLALGPVNSALPNPALPNNLVVPWWDDINLDPVTGGGNWYAASLTDGVNFFTVFEWENAEKFGDPASTYTFQIWIQDGTPFIWYTYDGLVGNTTSSTVGFEDSLAAVGVTYYFNGAGTAPVPGVDLLVIANPGESATITYQTEVTTGLPGDVKVNNAALRDSAGLLAVAWSGVNIIDPAISLAKTVSEDGSCGATSTLQVANTSEITYCYTVTNVGNAAMDGHTLLDDQLGVVFTGTLSLEPGQSVSVFATATLDQDTSNLAEWTATVSNTASPNNVASDTASATVQVIHYQLFPFAADE